MKKLFLVLLVPFLLYAAENYNGVNDTLNLATDAMTDGTKIYSDAYNLSDGYDLWVIYMVHDNSETGYADDSINQEWGVQIGNWCLDSAESIDTCWEPHIVIDTILQDSLGVSNNFIYSHSDGSVTRTSYGTDTLSVAGYAYQARKVDLDDIWGCLVRGWANSLGDPNRNGAGLQMRFQFIQRERQK